MDILPSDDFLNNNGRVIDSFLSENICMGLLEGYILTGRHGMFHTYEAFSRIIDSMASQHLKWMKAANEISWRKPISSLNIILSSHIWQQDHNGYTHQEPGFLNHLATKKKNMVGNDKCTPMLIAVLLTITKTWKQPKCPSIEE